MKIDFSSLLLCCLVNPDIEEYGPPINDTIEAKCHYCGMQMCRKCAGKWSALSSFRVLHKHCEAYTKIKKLCCFVNPAEKDFAADYGAEGFCKTCIMRAVTGARPDDS